MVLCTYAAAGGGHDAVAYLTNDDFSDPRLVWNEIGPATDSQFGAVAFVGGASRWVLSVGDRIVFHDAGNLVLNSGVTVPSPAIAPFGSTPATRLGGTPGTSSGTQALLVWSGTWAQSPLTTEALGARIDAVARTVGATFPLTTRPNSPPVGVNARMLVEVIPESSGGSTSWITAWREQLILANDQTLFVSRITAAGTVAGEAAAYFGAFNQTQPTEQRLAGRGGSYALVYNRGVTLSTQQVDVRPFTWSESSATPTFAQVQPLPSGPGAFQQLDSLASNGTTPRRWALIHGNASSFSGPYSTSLDELGSNGTSLRSASLPAATEASATFSGFAFATVTAERISATSVALRGRLLGPLPCGATPTLAGPAATVAGRNYMLFVTKPTTASSSTLSQFAFSLDPTPSVAPGIISLGLGNGFQQLFVWPIVEDFQPAACAGAWLLPSFASMQGLRVYFQAWTADFAQPSIFPLPTTGVVAIDFL